MDNLTRDDIFLKRKLDKFCEALGYVRGVTLSDTTSKTKLNWLIETMMVVEANLNEARNNIFYKWIGEYHLL